MLAAVTTEEGTMSGVLQDVSPGGVAVRLNAKSLPVGRDRVTLKLHGMEGKAEACIIERSANQASLAFIDRKQGQTVG
jgi:hypothetical protein